MPSSGTALYDGAAGRSDAQGFRLRFIHVSDIHLLSLEGVSWRRYLNKRLTGGINLLLNRSRHYDGALFQRTIAWAHELEVDRLVVTGDLTNLALESEFRFVHDVLEQAGLPVTIIPGNHDAYTRGAVLTRRFEHMLGRFMEGERATGEAAYPFVQRRDGVALVGVSTAIASLPLYATGRVGESQLRRLDAVLEALAREHVLRVVLIHHPVVRGVSKPRHDLLDLDAFGEVLRRRGADLVLHGHEHRVFVGAIEGPDGPIPVHGISSGTSLSQQPDRRGAFSLYEAQPGVVSRRLYAWDGSDFVPDPDPG